VRALVAVAALAIVGCSGTDGDTTARLPDLELEALDAGAPAIDLTTVRGPAVVNIWATWCTPCREELPAFQEVAATRDDVRFIGVNSVETGDARGYLDELGVTYEQFVDGRGDLAIELGAAALPVTIVLDADGAISTEHLGPMSVADLEQAIATAGG
jgi:thiol-disulfide isomerase/thioredoxin